MIKNIWNSWKKLFEVSQEQLIRLRVSAVFHRNVDEVIHHLNQYFIPSIFIFLDLLFHYYQLFFYFVFSFFQYIRQLKELTENFIISVVEEDNPKKQIQLKNILLIRENILLEVGRMIRLGRLLKTRLREPLCSYDKYVLPMTMWNCLNFSYFFFYITIFKWFHVNHRTINIICILICYILSINKNLNR